MLQRSLAQYALVLRALNQSQALNLTTPLPLLSTHSRDMAVLHERPPYHACLSLMVKDMKVSQHIEIIKADVVL